jgi:threonine dehydrogenase-like Zn-dependent dehydrogenase
LLSKVDTPIALIFDGSLRLADVPLPERKRGDVLIKVSLAGLCATDIEITRGYVPGFSGILGHEFIGHIAEADDPALVGKRATAEINCACGNCEFCRRGLERHCPQRSVIGIVNRAGCMAEYIIVPRENVVEVPASIRDTEAIFIEPLAAALEIMEQLSISPEHSVLLLGDGKLAQLIGRALKPTGCSITAVGKHPHKLSLLRDCGIVVIAAEAFAPRPVYDIVIEAAGNPAAFHRALQCVKPRGTIVLKSTYAGSSTLDASQIVVNEITLIGSRCGRLEAAIAFLREYAPDLSPLISATFPLDKALEAFDAALRKENLKIVLEMQAGGIQSSPNNSSSSIRHSAW